MGRVHVRAAGYGAGMNDMNPAPVISAADVTWLRTRRRTAVTDADRAAVRTSLRRLALDLERRPTPTSPLVPILLGVGAIALVSIAAPILLLRRELRRGAISDWHISDRRERLQPVPVLASLAAAILPLGLLLTLDGPRLLLVAFQSALLLVLLNHVITIGWKISQHVASIAASTTLITATLGIGAAPLLLLVPLVAWARVKVGAHTVAQTVMGGVVGAGIPLAVLRLAGVV